MKQQKKKDMWLLATKLVKKISGVSNAREYYESFLKNKTKKSMKC